MRAEARDVAAADQPIGPPRLLIDGRRAANGGTDPGLRILGLALVERLARAARRSGYGPIVLLVERNEAERFSALMAGLADVSAGDAALEARGGAARTICVKGSMLGERRWLEAAAAAPVAANGAAAPFDGVAVFGASVPLAEAAAAFARAPAAADSGAAGAPFAIRGAGDIPVAERRLLGALGKGTDGFMERNVERPISRRLSARLARTPITPNQMTLISAAVGLSAAPFFLSAAPLWQTAGALLFLAHSILDGCDGELARLKYLESRWGGILDFWVDNIVHSAIFGCMAVGWSGAIGAEWPLALGAAAVLGTLGSAGFVYWRVMRPKRGEGPLYTSVSQQPSGRLTAVLDALSRRDFIYLVLILSIPGKAAWFLAMAAVGAPAFFVFLLVVAAKDRKAGLAAPDAHA